MKGLTIGNVAKQAQVNIETLRQALINENPELVQENSRYVMRITGNDPEGTALRSS